VIYQSINEAVFGLIPPGTRSLLDVGCGGGVFGETVKRAIPSCSVTGVTFSEAEALECRKRLDRVEVADLNSFEPGALGRFDCIVCSHVLEHLHDPKFVLARLRGCLNPGGSVVVALPNVLFWKQRLQFLKGQFRYTEGGLMDETHLRFSDWSTAAALVTEAGFEITRRDADGNVPFASLLGRTIGGAANRRGLSWFPGLFGFQFVLLGRPRIS
jgi:cyclopropane fatty-acyl-phospholipid synthase-like methyltransferase